MDSGFAALLLAALVLGGILSWLQHRAYSNAVRRLSEQFRDSRDAVLVSGRGKGRLRGAVVLFVVDGRTRRIIAAEAMVGASVLARFHERPELLGALSTVADRATEKRVADAAQYAIEQYKTLARKGSAQSSTA
jgi:DNA-binding transcriptional regulator of glucitol operon